MCITFRCWTWWCFQDCEKAADFNRPLQNFWRSAAVMAGVAVFHLAGVTGLPAISSATNRFSICQTCEHGKHLMARFSQQDGATKASNAPTQHPQDPQDSPLAAHTSPDRPGILWWAGNWREDMEAEGGKKKVARTFKKNLPPPFSPLQTGNHSGICVPGLRKHIRRGGVG